MNKKLVVLIAAVAGFLIVLVAGGIAIGLYWIWHGGPMNKATGQLPVTVSSACITPLLPDVTDGGKFADAINNWISTVSPNSPFNGLGQYFVADGQAFGVNPAFMAAQAQKESSLGTQGIATNGGHNAFGRGAAKGQPNNGRFFVWPSFQASIDPSGPSIDSGGSDTEAQFLQREYLNQGQNTIETIVQKYAPPSENDTQQYIADMNKMVGAIMTAAAANGGVSCAGASSTAAANPAPAAS